MVSTITKGTWDGYRDKSDPDGEYIEIKHKRGEKVYTEIGWMYHRDDAKLTIIAVNQCQAVNPDNPQAVAENIARMYTLLKVFLEHQALGGQVQSLLAEIEKR